ncbi:Restriction endonuclease [Candidatus Electrothrix marina]|uniref:Restriction endonuclease n=1 Tax=Candidatus Electrothrix marina TaxID=1859130 RepID=A0A444JE16_9BACT|nr:Restriction endonuclease [Candidatus Electrothrix marina]
MYYYEVISDEYRFEEFVLDLFNAKYNTQSFQLYKTKGATQHGIDVFSTEKKIVIQCKKKDLSRTDYMLKKELAQDLDESLQAIEELPFNFEFFILATTTKKYTTIQDKTAKLSQDKPFDVQFLSWKDIERVIQQYPELRKQYYPHLVAPELMDSVQGSITPTVAVNGNDNMVAGRDLTVAQKIIKKNEVIPDAGGRHITDQEAYKIKNEVKKYSDFMKEAGLNPNPSKVWKRL